MLVHVIKLTLIAYFARAMYLGSAPLQQERGAKKHEHAGSGLLLRASGPPVGATYAKSVWLPLLGEQRISVTVLAGGALRLLLHGAITLDELAQYQASDNGRSMTKIAFELGPSTRRMLRRLHTSLRCAEYDAATDIAFFTVAPLFSPAVRVPLGRIKGASSYKSMFPQILQRMQQPQR